MEREVIWVHSTKKSDYLNGLESVKEVIARYPNVCDLNIVNRAKCIEGCTIDSCESLENCKKCFYLKNYIDFEGIYEREEQYDKYAKKMDNGLFVFELEQKMTKKTSTRRAYYMGRNLNDIFYNVNENADYTYYSDGENVRVNVLIEEDNGFDIEYVIAGLFRKLKPEYNVKDFERLLDEKKYNLSYKEIEKYTESILPDVLEKLHKEDK